MNKKLFTLLAVLLVSVAVGASTIKDDLRISKIVTYSEKLSDSPDKRDLVTKIGLDNLGATELKDVKLTLTIPELGLRRSKGPFSIYDHEDLTKTVLFEMLGDDVEPGIYDIKIVLSDDDTRRIKYSTIIVE